MSTANVMGVTLGASLVAEQKLATQLPTLLPNLTVLVDGVTMTGAEVVAVVEQHITAEQQILALKAQLRLLQTNVKPVRVKARAVVLSTKTAAVVAFGSASPSYENLGFAPAKQRKTVTVAEKGVAVEKGHATRVARGTKGPRQKESIHGTVPATPPATPAVK